MDSCERVDKIIKVYTSQEGCTSPLLVELDGGIRAVHKYPGNPQGILAVFNDYFASRIAQISGLNIPDVGIACIDEATMLLAEDTYQVAPYMGIGFYSTYISQTAPASKRILARATNLSEASKMILVDAVVSNMDRHTGNVLVNYQKENSRIYPIDFTHAFGGPDWTTHTLRIGDCGSPAFWIENEDFYRLLKSAGAEITQERMEGEIVQLQSRITDGELNTIIGELPETWVREIGSGNIEHARQYVLNRVANLEDIVLMIKREGGMI